MAVTLGCHLVLSAYGMWLPGDERGHWSSEWDEQLGYIQPHHLSAGDPVRERMARELMKHPATRLDVPIIRAIAEAVGRCVGESNWQLSAFTLEPTHAHLLITYSNRPIAGTVKWIKQRTTRAVHETTGHAGPVWCGGSWKSFVFDGPRWNNTVRYIQRHNERKGLPASPYAFVTPLAY
jgi:REP element-mobilizing transposase RayT